MLVETACCKKTTQVDWLAPLLLYNYLFQQKLDLMLLFINTIVDFKLQTHDFGCITRPRKSMLPD
jgi:hypothetical protein